MPFHQLTGSHGKPAAYAGKIGNKSEERTLISEGGGEKMREIEDLVEFKRRAREQREREGIRDALGARKFTGEKTFQQGLDLIRFAIKLHAAGKRA